jgi:hypothetical protein
LKQSQVVLRDTGEVTCGHRRPLAFQRLTAILMPLSEDAIALGWITIDMLGYDTYFGN